jgi:hypothetical protein
MSNRNFLNGDQEFKNRGFKHLAGRAEDFVFFRDFNHCESIEDLKEELRRTGAEFTEIRQSLRMFNDLGSFFDYGLSFDYTELGTWDDQTEDYFRYQLSWGGPSDELRFYEDGSIYYVFMDWGTGVSFEVTTDSDFSWLYDWFEGCDMLNFQQKREETDYFERLYELENEEEDEENE